MNKVSLNSLAYTKELEEGDILKVDNELYIFARIGTVGRGQFAAINLVNGNRYADAKELDAAVDYLIMAGFTNLGNCKISVTPVHE